jgi:light-regulated signal transduction histidine kinase (bacteriophytochrome)
VAIFDTEMRHKFVSTAWMQLSDHNDSFEYINKIHYDVYTWQPASWRAMHQKVLKGEIVTWSQSICYYISQRPIWTEGSMHPWYTSEGSIGGIIIYLKDVTNLLKSEEKLKNTIKNLNRSNHALERFAHVCSHDLKEPLRNISNFIQLLLSRNVDNLDDESLEYVTHILKGTNHMSTLINDILMYSKVLGQSNSEKISIDMNKKIQAIRDQLNFQISEIGAQFNITALPVILGVPTQIKQLLMNIINNALKFHSEKPLIITIFTIEQTNFWEFHIRDNGIGIDEEYKQIIFSMFKRLHNKYQYEGSGIGLSICQQIVQEHLGEIYVQSVPEGGSDFVFTLPK